MIINDKDLGEIKLVKNAQARRIIVRRKDDYLQLTYPPGTSLTYIEKTIEEMKPRLFKLLEKKKAGYIFTPQTDFKTFSFALNITESTSTSNFYMKLKDGILYLSCPFGTNYKDFSVQTTIKKLVEKALRYEAKRLFPQKVEAFARQHGFTYSGVKINQSRTRWGSCSSKKSINLSYHCMLLPEYLVDFVILHELCHTCEMNHGERFWALLDKVSGGKAKQLTKELRSYKTGW
ncbi:M48 family metallopeptidase [Prevotella sp. 10(H)]|uniref:M48 family metallopeptidase n=1 Tax=Prevotella sp. 10(H) TaxID=1158294 RepID=UPI0004A6FEC5|nr:M48 family metallopeptidase [Prevotella sp. 10(H)]